MKGIGQNFLLCSYYWQLSSSSSAGLSASSFQPVNFRKIFHDCTRGGRTYRSHSTKSSQVEVTESLGEQVRRAMRQVPHHLTIVTAYSSQGAPAGLLVSSFNTVTLYPEPFVSFNIKLPSSTYDAILSSGRFALTPIWSVKTARRYSKQEYGSTPHRDGNNHTSDQVLDGGIFKLECQWLEGKSASVGDHIIMVGRVLKHVPGSGTKEFALPLVYVNGCYSVVSKTKDL